MSSRLVPMILEAMGALKIPGGEGDDGLESYYAPTLGEAFRVVISSLRGAGISLPDLEARLVVQRAFEVEALDLFCFPERRGDVATWDRLREYVDRRLCGEPLSRIFGEREFFGRTFHISPDVLDPRPDSECVIEAIFDLYDPLASDALDVLDMGTGSGALLITLLSHAPVWRGVGVDISSGALGVARKNGERLGISDRVVWIESDWFSRVKGKYDLILSNPPYIPTGELSALPFAVRGFDPTIALDGGVDGLEPYRLLAAQVGGFLKEGGRCVVEIGHTQAQDVITCFLEHGLLCSREEEKKLGGIRQDLGGRDRVLIFKKQSVLSCF